MFPEFGNYSDFPFLPPSTMGDVQVFNAPANAITQWQQWVKPRGITMVRMILIGGGGGGGAGFTRASTNAGGGGAGGACSGVAVHDFPAYILPDILKVSVGLGGLGGSGSGVAGGNATSSYVATGVGLTAGSTIPNVIAESNAANTPGGGAAGANTGAATGGAVPQIATKGRQGWAQVYSTSVFTVGIVGAAGGTPTAAGTAVTGGWTLIPLSPGAGGGGVTSVGTGFAGGAISLNASFDFADGALSASNIIPGGTAGSGAAVGGNGSAGIQLLRPLVMTGGSGGGSADGQAGGIGGKGGIGCGGGGGGSGTTGGRGGDGGNGIVIMISW
jgi:hypothetical protein